MKKFTIRDYCKVISIGLKTAFEFSIVDDITIKKLMGVVGLRLKEELNGNSVLSFEDVEPKKNIICSRSFDGNYKTLKELEERVSTFAVTCAEKLRKQKSTCNSIVVFVNTNRFRTELPQYSKSIVVQLPYASNSSFVLAEYAIKGLLAIFKNGFNYKKAGVIVMDFNKDADYQVNLFDNQDSNHSKIMRVVDKIISTLGEKKIKLGSQDLSKSKKIKQQKILKSYSTKISDIIEINAIY